MKKILLLLLVALTSCYELDLNPVNSLGDENYFQSDEDAVAAVNGVYAALVESESVVIGWLVELGSDATQNGESMPDGSGAELSHLQVHAANLHNGWAWGDTYYGIGNATTLIDKLNDTDKPFSDKIRKRVRGEAQFLRAYFHFLLVQLFGDIPLITKSGYDSGINVDRDDVQVVYQQIVDDLINAANDLSDYPDTEAYGVNDKGRVSQQSAYGLLAKVFLTWAQTDGTNDVTDKLNKSVQYANLVTNFTLEKNFHSNWEKDNRYGKEVLFATNYVVSQESAGDGGNHLTHCAFSTGFEQQTPHTVVSDRTFFDRFDDNDQRKLATYLTRATNPDTDSTTIYILPRFAKYVDLTAPATSSKNRELNATNLRYAEVLLIKAEAINERDHNPNAEAYEAINKVRRRAFKVGEFDDGTATLSTDEVELKNLDYISFRKALRRERLFELTYEQVRWFDLVRWKVLVKTVRRVEASGKKNNVDYKHYRFPIPQPQRDLNQKLWQNWGYDGSTANTPPYADTNYEGSTDNNDGWNDEEIEYLYQNVSEPK